MNIPNKSIALWNLRSLYNVGSIVRCAASFGILHIYCIGTTPYPSLEDDSRLPHVQERATRSISKTALGAEQHVNFVHHNDLNKLLASADKQGIHIIALEQASNSKSLNDFEAPDRWMLIVGEETSGLPDDVLAKANTIVEIEQPGPKGSLNVSSAAAIALFSLSQ